MFQESSLYKILFMGIGLLSIHLSFYMCLLAASITIPLFIFALIEKITTIQDLCEHLLLKMMRQPTTSSPTTLY